MTKSALKFVAILLAINDKIHDFHTVFLLTNRRKSTGSQHAKLEINTDLEQKYGNPTSQPWHETSNSLTIYIAVLLNNKPPTNRLTSKYCIKDRKKRGKKEYETNDWQPTASKGRKLNRFLLSAFVDKVSLHFVENWMHSAILKSFRAPSY